MIGITNPAEKIQVQPVEKPAPTAEDKAQVLLSKLMTGKQVHQIFADNMKEQLLINGKPMEHWEQHFKINIPTDNLTPSLCKELSMRLIQLNQEAAFFQAIATAKAQIIKRGTTAAYNDKFWAIVQQYKSERKKLPAAATLETMARVDNEDLDSAQTIADIESKFWKDILDHLATCRKLIENASMNIATELKSLNNEKFLDNITRKMI
jgi:hypothetical protein